MFDLLKLAVFYGSPSTIVNSIIVRVLDSFTSKILCDRWAVDSLDYPSIRIALEYSLDFRIVIKSHVGIISTIRAEEISNLHDFNSKHLFR